MKKILKNVAILLFVILMLFILSGCKNEKEEKNILEEKVKNEIEYLDSKIVSMLNSINNISYQNYKVSTEEIELDKNSGQSGEQTATSDESGQKDKGEQGESQENSGKNEIINKSEMSYSSILNAQNEEINWDIIKSDIEVLHSTWNTIVIDLEKKEGNQESITNFGKELDNTTILIKEQKKPESLIGLAKMYSYLPTFLEDENEDTVINIKKVKVHVLNAYSLVETENWNQVKDEINQAVDIFNTYRKNEKREDIFNLEKTGIALKELQNSVDLRDKQVFYIKYRNSIEQLGIL